MSVIPLVDEGLGNSAYLLDLGDGRALAVDASRDLRALRRRRGRRGLSVAYAADTHLHADFLTGARPARAPPTGPRSWPRRGEPGVPAHGLADGDEVDLGGLTLRALATPGHTHEHLAFELLDGAAPLGVFTGGSLIVGLGRPHRPGLARSGPRSWRARSTGRCSGWPSSTTTSRCGPPTVPARSAPHRPGPSAPRRSAPNAPRTPCCAPPTRTRSSSSCWTRWAASRRTSCRLGEINRRGPALVDGLTRLPRSPSADVARLRGVGRRGRRRPTGARLRRRPRPRVGVDPAAAGVRHLAGLARRRRYAARGRPRQPTRTPPRSSGRPARSATTRSSASSTVASPPGPPPGEPTARIPLVEPREPGGGGPVLDVRQDDEFDAGHVPGARHVELGDLWPTECRDDPARTHGGDVRPRRAGDGRRQPAGPRRPPRRRRARPADPRTGPTPPATPWRSARERRHPRRRTTGAHRAGAAAERRPVHAAGRGQRPGRRHARPGADRPAAAGRSRSSASPPTPPG